MPEKILEVKDLHVYFYTYAGVVKAVAGVSFEVYKGECLGIVGETGCGKTVTSRAITRLIPTPGRIERGQIIYYRDGKPIDLLKLSEEELRKIRGSEIAYIFQDPTAALDPLWTCGYQVAEAIVAHNPTTFKKAWKRVIELLRAVLIPDPVKRAKAYPFEMSGGMRQRVVIAISLSNNPRILIADEPTTNVDVTIQAQLLDLLRKLQQKYRTTLILITHNMGVIAEMADRVIVMYAGKIVEIGDVFTIFDSPAHPYTRGLLRCVPNPLKRIERLESIPGMIPNLINPPPGCRFHPRCSKAMPICKKKEPPMVEIEKGHKVACWLYAEPSAGS